jgi:hypothetical protein
VLCCRMGVEHVADVGLVAGIGRVGREVGVGRVAGVVGIGHTVGERRCGWASALCSQRMAGICVVQALGGCRCG